MADVSVTDQVRKLYDEVPYAAYGEDYFPVVKSLGLNREEFAVFARGKKALEIGCGGGQLSLFLAKYFDSVTGVDISEKSLEAARAEAAAHQANNVKFLSGDLFSDVFIGQHTGQYDFILCYGVLHHTADPAAGFSRLVRMLKPGGILTVGVYSRTELMYRIRRKIVLLLAGNDWGKRRAWARRLFFRKGSHEVAIFDGYVHPQVSFHSPAEVVKWQKSNHLKYLGAWPPVDMPSLFRLWRKQPINKQTRTLRYPGLHFLLAEFIWILSGKQVMVTMSGEKEV